MRVSQLIKKLKDVKKEHGDLDIVFCKGEGSRLAWVEKVTTFQILDDNEEDSYEICALIKSEQD